MSPPEEAEEWRRVKYSLHTPTDGHHNQIITSKYTLLTFLPKSIFEQFRKRSNIFFLVLTIIIFVLPGAGDNTGFVMSFIAIVSYSILKNIYEDWLKHKTDDKVNSRLFSIFNSNRQIMKVKSKSLQVGHVIRLDENEDVPCDLLLLSSVSQGGKSITTCGVNTANLDGEPNTKVRYCPFRFQVDDPLRDDDFGDALANSELEVEFAAPTADLYKFSGLGYTAQTRENPAALSMENLLLRGTSVKNSQFIYGLVVYTGHDTRLSHNLAQRKLGKFSVIDFATNRLILIMAIIVLVTCAVAIGGYYWFDGSTKFGEGWYLPEFQGNQLLLGAETLFMYVILMSGMVPVALSASVETQKIMANKFFQWDNDMKCRETGKEAICNNSDVVDELGQIEYLLTDKTGTLTENNLKFKCCSFGGTKYEYCQDTNGNQFYLEPQNTPIGLKNTEERVDFLKCIALCHTVQAVRKENGWEYQGTSSDEEVLLGAANKLGISFIGEDSNGQLIIINEGKQTTFKRHFVFEFDADRKCMSIIVEDVEGRFFLIAKGAETAILPKCEKYTEPEILSESTHHVSQFAKNGLRTLVVGKREISLDEFVSIQSKMELIRRDPSSLVDFYNEVECDLRVVGVTGVEDKLQSNVPETLKGLKEGGIRIWVLTGDKLETALNISVTCGLIHGKCSELCTDENSFSECTTPLVNITNPDELNQKLISIRDKMDLDDETKTLVVDSATFAIGYEHSRQLFGTVAMAFPQIIFCRMTPLQKALVVKLIKSTGTSAHICAVGDGGNDVAMIQEAHVGIGILGREGRQAAGAADFAVPKFEHLRKAILVHGNWNYHRLSTLVLYFAYQGFPVSFPQFFFGLDSGFTGYPLFDPEFGMFFTIFFSIFHINVYAFTEKKHSAEHLLRNPGIYKENSGNKLVGLKWTLYWIGTGVWHTLVMVGLPRFVWQEIHNMDWATYSFFMSAALIAVTDLKVVSQTRTFTWYVLLGQIVSLGSMIPIYSLLSEIIGTGPLRYAYFSLLSLPHFWLMTILVVALSLLPDLVLIASNVVVSKKNTTFHKA